MFILIIKANVLVYISDVSGRKFVYESKNTATQNFAVVSHASEVKYQVLPKKGNNNNYILLIPRTLSV
jgi:hypothetical protein